ncbi:MAG: hypothetical protein ACYTFK_06845 [Planctomycetota bacterium]
MKTSCLIAITSVCVVTNYCPSLYASQLQSPHLSPSATDSNKTAGNSSKADAAAEMARKLQDPLANITAIMTDNDILYNPGSKKNSYSFQIQPVKAFDFPEKDFSLIARGIIPIVGIAPETFRPILDEPLPTGSSRTWGLADITTQFFIAPKTDSPWKWGAGPQLSWKTSTDENLRGPGWGAGYAGVLVGDLNENVSVAIISGHLWGYDGNFSTSILQPNTYYNFTSIPGAYIGYNAVISYDWKADSSNKLTVPIGAVLGRTLDIGNGCGLDIFTGAYWNAVKPDGGNDWQIKWGVSLLFP